MAGAALNATTVRRARRVAIASLVDVLLFFSSAVVMFTALALRFECPPLLRWTCAGFAALGAVTTFYFLVVLRQRKRRPVSLRVVEDRGESVGGYLATYLLPIVVVAAPTTSDIAAYALVLLSIVVVYVRSNLKYVNPTLYLLTFRLLAVRTDEEFDGYLLTRRNVKPGSRLVIAERGRLLLDCGSIDDDAV